MNFRGASVPFVIEHFLALILDKCSKNCQVRSAYFSTLRSEVVVPRSGTAFANMAMLSPPLHCKEIMGSSTSLQNVFSGSISSRTPHSD